MSRRKNREAEARRTGRGPGPEPRRRDYITWLVAAAMLVAVLAVYVPFASSPTDNALVGLDYFQLHYHRIRFAQEALFGAHPHLPGWYPRELLGTPFWSNVQDFPFLPTRLLMIAWDPLTIYPAAVNLAAILAAVFTFLYARRLGIGRVGAAAAGWTFACSGFFASRVMAGHLPLLEAYGGLPLILWLVERCRESIPAGGRPAGRALLALGLACFCLALAGHPQLPLYAVGVGAIYAMVRARSRGALRLLAVMATGVAGAAFVLWPLWLLIGRSTRVLALDPASNDISFPYSRVIAFILPWKQGWAGAVPRFPQVPIVFPDDAYFWETVCYVGWVPLLAVAYLLARAISRRVLPRGPWAFLTIVAVLGLLLAFPFARAPFAHLPGTFLRSPCRLLYFTAFGLALGLGAAVQAVLSWAGGRRLFWAFGLVGVVLAAHLFDLGYHDRWFIRMVTFNTTPTESDEQLRRAAGDGRVAIDSDLWTPLNREIDDIGYFDSIALAKSYTGILDLAGQSSRLNSQYLDGSNFRSRALQNGGVRFVATTKVYPGTPDAFGPPRIRVYPIRDPAPRAAFYPSDAAMFLDVKTLHQNLRDPDFDLSRRLMLPVAGPVPAATSAATSSIAGVAVSYVRNSEDDVEVNINNAPAGYLRWLEAWDPGWTATVDDAAAPILAADDLFMAVSIPQGSHTVRLRFATPGATTGRIISVVSLALLGFVCFPPRLPRAQA